VQQPIVLDQAGTVVKGLKDAARPCVMRCGGVLLVLAVQQAAQRALVHCLNVDRLR
jgi:hypothetical protein